MSLLIFRFWKATVITFLKNGLKLLKDEAMEIILNYGRTETQSWPQGSRKNNTIWKTRQLIFALHFKSVIRFGLICDFFEETYF